MKKFCTEAFMMAVAILLPFIAGSCRDDLLYYDGLEPVEEGLPATVVLKFDMSEMSQQTRAIIDDERTNYCNNIWVGVYKKNGGACVFNKIFTSPADVSEAVGTEYGLGTISIEAESGEMQIVAAANVDVIDGLASSGSTKTESLDSLLLKAKTWSQFKSIIVKRSSPDNISQLEYSIPMSGYYCYTKKDAGKATDDVAEYSKVVDSIPTVTITEGLNELPGSIKFRRLISYNAFYIASGNENLDIRVKSWQVCNNPYYCYLMEDSVNAGDITNLATPYGTSIVDTKFETKTHPVKGTSCETFEFYQFENKHDACKYADRPGNDWVGIKGATANPYDEREREYKDTYSDSERTTLADDGLYHQNTGIYKSLVDTLTSARSMANNNASYVVLKAQLQYYYDPASDPTETTPVDPSAGGAVRRVADVEYVIHLGYCEGNSLIEKANDFNCRRNTKYLYTVTINSVNNIVVEAKAEDESGEKQSGAEGRVYDTTTNFMELDSHYNVFNISLTNVERSELHYMIEAPYGNTTHTLDSQLDSRPWEESSNALYPFYSWVKFKPAKSENELAIYKDGTDDNSQWTLKELQDVEHYAGNNGSTDKNNPDVQWYTVFIDEYVYHIGETGSDETGYDETTWQNYTNKDNRSVELYTTEAVSKDNNSKYVSAKYGFSQKAIQTFYKGCTTALGVEHTNESYGLNFRWEGNTATSRPSSGIYSTENGRYNLKKACSRVAGSSWNNVLSVHEQESIPSDTNSVTGIIIGREAATYPVTRLHNIYGTSGITSWSHDPSPKMTDRFYYVNTACMNRNRDLNGNGVIDDNEIRWFLPTYSQYAQIFIGLEGLVSPLFEWTDYSEDRFAADAYNYKGSTLGRMDMHFTSSDGYFIFAEEGYSRGNDALTQNTWAHDVYQIRCVRYLGDNPGTEPSAEKCEIEHAYHKEGNYIIATYYEDVCMRSYVSTYLPSHFVNSSYNKPYKKIELSTGRATSIRSTNTEIGVNANGTLYLKKDGNDANSRFVVRINAYNRMVENNDICATYTQEEGGKDLGKWRMPNIKEIAMMFNTGAFITGDNYVPSCTHEYFLSFPDYTDANPAKYCFFGRKGASEIARSIISGSKAFEYLTVRCVRDVKE